MARLNINDSLRTDIAHFGDFIKTQGGDLSAVNGLQNLKRALFHRMITVPGALVHRPLYGCGILLFQNALNSFQNQQRIAELIQDQFPQDPRVKSVTGVSVEINDTNPALTKISVTVIPVGYTEQQMVFTPFNGVSQ